MSIMTGHDRSWAMTGHGLSTDSPEIADGSAMDRSYTIHWLIMSCLWIGKRCRLAVLLMSITLFIEVWLHSFSLFYVLPWGTRFPPEVYNSTV